ncbi:MAG TPA: YraN family protein [Streptosporangiaceae bacterium]
MNTRRNHRGSLGRKGEAAAARYLRGLGWQIVERNWRCRDGELDIVAYDGSRHVVCEVKTRTNIDYGTPLEAITSAKAARLRRLARRWADEHGVRAGQIRIDVIGLVCDGPNGFSVDHCREVC